MQNNYQNILECIDILSVALVVGLAMEDAPPRNSRNSESGEGITEYAIQGNEDDEERSDDEEEKAKLQAIMDRMGLSSKPNATPTPTPNSERHEDHGDHHVSAAQTVAEGEASGANNSKGEDSEIDNEEEEIKEKIRKLVEARIECERSTTLRVMAIRNRQLKGRMIDNENENELDKLDDHEPRGGGEYNLRAMAMAAMVRLDNSDLLEYSSKDVNKNSGDSSPEYDETAPFLHAPQKLTPFCVVTSTEEDDSTDEHEGLGSNTEEEHNTEAEFVQHVQDSLAQVPALTFYEKKGPHSNSERELETAAAIRDNPQANREDETDEEVTDAEFVQHVRDSLEKAPALTNYGKKGLHSNSERELETAAAIRDAGISRAERAAATQPPSLAEQVLHSNTEREAGGAAAATEAHVHFDGPHTQRTPRRQTPKAGHSGRRHSNTERELVPAGEANEALLEPNGPFALNAPAQPPSWGNKIHSNTERELETAGTNDDAVSNAKRGLPSSSARDLESVGAARERRVSQRSLIGASVAAALRMKPAHYMPMESEPANANLEQAPNNTTSSPSSSTARELESEGAGRETLRRVSQRSLIGSSVAAALRMKAAHYSMGIDSNADLQRAPNKREQKLSQNSVYGLSYAKRANSYPGGSSAAADFSSDERRPAGGQKRKLSQNDLLGLAHAAILRDVAGKSDAQPSNAPQPSPLSHLSMAPAGPSSYASQGQGFPSVENDFGPDSSRPAQTDSTTQMDVESSTDAQTPYTAPMNEEIESLYTFRNNSLDSGQHRYTAQRDLNSSHRYHPYGQPQASTQSEKTFNEEGEGNGLGSSGPPSQTSSGFHAHLWSGSSAQDPDPDPDPDDDGEGEGNPESIPEDDSGSSPSPPVPDEDQNYNNNSNNLQLIPFGDVDSYLPPPPPDQDVYNYQQPISHIDHHTNNYNLESQYFPYPPEPLPMLPCPQIPPNGNYFAAFQAATSHFSSIQVPQHETDRSYLRVRHPGDRLLYRRPRCGLQIVTGMRRDNGLPVDRRKHNRIPRGPGRVDITFAPRVGDIILRHVRLPGQGAVEFWYPDMETEDGDSLCRFTLDPFSYDSGARQASNLLIVKAKGYINFQKMWIYMGRATYSVTKAEQRVLGIGAKDGVTIYAR